jgi:hypothetical protein
MENGSHAAQDEDISICPMGDESEANHMAKQSGERMAGCNDLKTSTTSVMENKAQVRQADRHM